jgi:hypothetical protein
MHRNAHADEVLSLLLQAMSALHAPHKAALERALIAPRYLAVEDSPGESVVAVAAFGRELLYWSDVEEGWELAIPSEGGTIPTRGCNQFELGHVLHRALGSAVLSNLAIDADVLSAGVRPPTVRRSFLR